MLPQLEVQQQQSLILEQESEVTGESPIRIRRLPGLGGQTVMDPFDSQSIDNHELRIQLKETNNGSRIQRENSEEVYSLNQ